MFGMRKIWVVCLQDVVRMADARLAQALRRRVEAQSGSAALARRMVPLAVQEEKYADLAQRFEARLFPERQRETAPPLTAALQDGLPSPAKVRTAVLESLERLQQQLPRVQGLLAQATVQQMVLDINMGIMQRVAARSVKFLTAGATLRSLTAQS